MENPTPASDNQSLMPLSNGVYADTGEFLPQLAPTAISGRTKAHEEALEQDVQGRAMGEAFPVGVDDPNDLSLAGWGVIFAAGTDSKIKEALSPLLEHRKQQVGENAEKLFKIFEGPDGYRPGDSARTWLDRRGVSMHVVEPLDGVPYYLLIVGSPEQIPFEFQYTLDIFWGVGRLHFERLDDYRQYADSVVAYETAAEVQHTRRASLFAPCHDFDQATQLFVRQVATPLAYGEDSHLPLGKKQKFGLHACIGESATKDTLRSLFKGDGHAGAPALLLTGSHGMAFKQPDDPRLSDQQGALVCQDWTGRGGLTAEHWFAAADVPADAHLHGLMHFFFACYGAGWPQHDNYDRTGSAPRQIAEKPAVAKLPQQLLAHPNGGAAAVLGHVDRAWSYSFRSQRGSSQIQGFRDVMGRLMRGDRVGFATDFFNLRWAALSADLLDSLDDRGYVASVTNAEVASRWVARDDARNYVVLGDPATRLRTEDMQPLPG